MKGLRVAIATGIGAALVVVSAGSAMAGDIVVTVDDFYETPHNTAIETDPLANDNLPPFPDNEEFGIVSDPTNGTLSPGGDETKRVYTPDAGFVGTDSYEYFYGYDSIPVSFDLEAAQVDGCDHQFCFSATVFILVAAPPATTTTTVAPTTTTSTTVAVAAATVPPTTTTTVAAQAQLPVTGGNGALAVIGFSAAAAGVALVAIARRRSVA